LWLPRRVCYYSRVHRLAFFMCAVLMLSACGGRKANVSVPPGSLSISDRDLEGIASYYAEPYHGRRTASGEVFDTYNDMTAAHKTLPFNTVVRVTNKSNGESVDVRINDRGPFIQGRIIDLSLVAARKIEMVRAGVVPVKLTILKAGDGARVSGPASPNALYAVQVGAFESLKSAEDLKARLEQKKFEGVSIQTVAGETTIYRVRIGREPDLESANRLASQLRKQDLNTFVVRVN
jgi:rare lipoprotein A